MPTKINHFRLAEENMAYIKNIRDDHKFPTDIDEICLALKIYSEAVDKASEKIGSTTRAIKGDKKAHYILSSVLSQAFKSYSLQDTYGLCL